MRKNHFSTYFRRVGRKDIWEVRKIITKDSQAYRVLAILCMSGECSEQAICLVMPQESYRQKVLQKLITDKLITRYQKDDVRGYRLAKRGKDLLLMMDRESFAFFLLDGVDFSMRRPVLRYRRRQHRISETLAMMERAKVETYRTNKNLVFEKTPRQSEEKAQSAFYLSREVKVQTDLTRKMVNSKMTGAWLARDVVWLCYNTADEMPRWYENVERRANILVCSMLREYLSKQRNANALLFGISMEQAKRCLADGKQRAYFMHCSFERFCFIPLDSRGIVLLQMLNEKEIYDHLFSILTEDLEEKQEGEYIIHDGFNQDGQPVLICIDCDLKRLVQFQTQLAYIGRKGEVICFDFQKEAICSYCGEETKISEVDFETVRESFFPG